MNIEEYRNKRRNRLQKLNEKLSNMPELADDKVHGEVDATVVDAIKSSNERDKLRKDAFKDKNKEVREFIKKQDKDREVDADDKSEKRLMLDESLFTEDADNKPKYAVIKPNGKYAGAPCFTNEEAKELAAQEDGREIYELRQYIND